MSNEALWYLDIESKVFTLIKGKTYSKLKKKYPTILFTSIDAMPTDGETYSHTVYIHELGGVEMGKDLDNTGVNAYESTFEVKVSVTSENSNKKTEVREITGYIADAFKSLKFDIILMPTVEITDSAYTVPMRFRRVIGANDTIK